MASCVEGAGAIPPMEEGAVSDGQVPHVATHIHDLPDECLVDIITRVGDTCRLTPSQKLYMGVHHPLQCASVCKHWSSKVDSAVSTLRLTPSRFTDDLARHIGSRFSHLRTLTFDQVFRHLESGDPLLTLALLTRNLEHLEAHFLDKAPSAAVAQALAKWTLLRHLDVRINLCDDATLAALRQLSNLRHFALNCYDCDDLPGLCARLGDALTMPLTRLELSCPAVPPALPPHLSKVLKKLVVGRFHEPFLPDSLGALLFPELETLRLESLQALVELPDSIGSLSRSLTSLDLFHCERVVALPRSVGKLANLRELRIVLCRSIATWPDNLGDMRALRSLTIDGCRTPPRSLGQLTSLRHLSLRGVDSVPEDVGDLLGLETLELESDYVSKLPRTFGRLSSLQALRLILWNANFELLGQVGDLTALRKLQLSRCGTGQLSDEVYESLGRLSNLEIFEIGMLSRLQRLPDVRRWGALTRLEITSCGALEALPEEMGVWLGATLRELHLVGCASLVSLPESVGELRCLELLLVARCKRLERLPESVGALTALRVLVVRDCGALVSLPTSLAQLSGLRIEHS